MKKFNIGGMSCAACSARVEKAVSSLDGISKCSVNLLTETMTVEGTASDTEIISAVVNAGYTAKADDGKSAEKKEEKNGKSETKIIVTRLIASLVLLIPLMYVSMGHTMWNFPVPSAIENGISLGIIQLLFSGAVMVINQKFFINGFKGIIHLSPNMDTLVAIGSASSFIYSAWVLISEASGGTHSAGHDYYFESTAMILTLITVGKLLEAYSKGKTTDAIKSLMKMTPDTAKVIRDGVETEIDAAELEKGDIFVLRPGYRIPADGIVTEGIGAVDESMLTGEAIPVNKNIGDKVSGGSTNVDGYLECRATGVGEETAIAKIIQTVNDAASSKAPISKKADAVAGVFVPVVMGISLITLIVWLALGEDFSFALARAISVLVISCPCSLGLATPVAVMVGSGIGAKHGILFKSAEMLEEAGKTETVVFDKTGTLTDGKMSVIDTVPLSCTKNKLLTLAYTVETKSEHPIAKAICTYASNVGIEPLECDNFASLAGRGVKATVEGKTVIGASARYSAEICDISKDLTDMCRDFAKDGKTPLIFTENGTVLGVITVADTVKEDAASAVSELSALGVKTVMLTGDSKAVADSIAAKLNISEVYAEVLPDGKEKIIKSLCEKGKCGMVGDGVNDAPALMRANVGIAVGAGTDVAIDSADIVLASNNVSGVVDAVKLSRRTLLNVKENLFWAFLYNSIGIPIAAGVLIKPFGIELSPMIAAAAMSLSSFCVVCNALRLNLYKIRKQAQTEHSPDAVNNMTKSKEKKEMTKTVKIEGMMCPHCEARVAKALSELPGVENVVASHETKSAKLTLSSDVSDELIKETVEKQGYSVI